MLDMLERHCDVEHRTVIVKKFPVTYSEKRYFSTTYNLIKPIATILISMSKDAVFIHLELYL